jgi:hypothetical protein
VEDVRLSRHAMKVWGAGPLLVNRRRGPRWGIEVFAGRFGAAVTWRGVFVTAEYFI